MGINATRYIGKYSIGGINAQLNKKAIFNIILNTKFITRFALLIFLLIGIFPIENL